MCWAVRHCWISQRKVNVRLQKRTGFSQSHISFEPLPDMLTLCVLIFFQCLKSRHAPQLAYSFYSQASVLILLTGISCCQLYPLLEIYNVCLKHVNVPASFPFLLSGVSRCQRCRLHRIERASNMFTHQLSFPFILSGVSRCQC